jgi:hypothetical protein
VGISGSCDQAVGRYTAAHAVLWDNGTVTDIGAGVLPAPFWNTPMAISEHGDVVRIRGRSERHHRRPHACVHLDTREGGMAAMTTMRATTARRPASTRSARFRLFRSRRRQLARVCLGCRQRMDARFKTWGDYPKSSRSPNDINDAGNNRPQRARRNTCCDRRSANRITESMPYGEVPGKEAGFIVMGAQWFGITVFHRRRQMFDKLPNDHQVVNDASITASGCRRRIRMASSWTCTGSLDLHTSSIWRPDVKAPMKKLN